MNIIRSLLFYFLLIICNNYASAKNVTAETADLCSKVSECVDFYDVYNGDSVFRNALIEAYKNSGINKLSWFEAGTHSSLYPIVINGVSYLIGGFCEPHNCPHAVDVLYQLDQKRAVGRYQTDSGKSIWFGMPTPTEYKVILNYNSDSPLRKAIQNSNSELPFFYESEKIENRNDAITATKTIGKYEYIAHIGIGKKPVKIMGAITLTDVGLTLSGEQPDQTSVPSMALFFDAYEQAKNRTLYSYVGRNLGPDQVHIESVTYHNATWGWSSEVVIFHPIWMFEHSTPLRFESKDERDRFASDLTGW